MLILKLLASYLALGVDPPEPDPPAPAPDEPDMPDLDAPDDPDAPDPAASADDPDDSHPKIVAARERAEKAEREARESREALARASAPSAPVPADAERAQAEREDARLRDPAITPLEKWQIESDRTMRANSRVVQGALHEARELADRTAYESLCATTPVAKKYKDRVETKLAEIRKNGGNLDRKVVLKMLIGDDYVEGRIKTKKAEPKVVDRGAPAQARSDVRRGASGNSEREKRRARLEGRII